MTSHDHPHPSGDETTGPGPRRLDRRTFLGVGGLGLGGFLLAACASPRRPAPSGPIASPTLSSLPGPSTSTSPTTAAAPATTVAPGVPATTLAGPAAKVPPGFEAFAATVKAFTKGDVWLVESDGMPAHNMMVGITSWQQQVPVPQPYSGANAWQIPVTPQLADKPVSARTGLFRGAIALAVNGVPIFNALNNRGDDAFLAGELDEWGGHSGRADDYHYHVAPFHLQATVGPGKPIAYALDGFAIYGATEPDGAPLTAALDEYNGHLGGDGVYHYHGTKTYPYINGGLRGVVRTSDQVEPQPVTKAFRPAGTPLRGATISGFEALGGGRYRLDYTLNGQTAHVAYQVDSKAVRFEFTDTNGAVRNEVYTR